MSQQDTVKTPQTDQRINKIYLDNTLRMHLCKTLSYTIVLDLIN